MKESIIKYLTKKGIYTPIYDFHIDQLVDLYELYQTIRANIDRDPENRDHYISLNECGRNIQTLSKTLGLSPAHSKVFKDLDVVEDDGFDD